MVTTIDGLEVQGVEPLSNPIMKSYFNYMFARAFEDYNKSCVNNGQPVLPMSRGREIYDLFVKNLAERTAYLYKNPDGSRMTTTGSDGRSYYVAVPGTLENASMASAAMSMSYAFEQMTGKPFLKGVQTNASGYLLADEAEFMPGFNKFVMNRYYAEFDGMTGWSKNRDQRQQGRIQTGYLPISPFDPEYQENETVLSKGSEVLYAPLDKVCHMEQGSDGKFYPKLATEEQQQDIALFQRKTNSKGSTFEPIGVLQEKESAGINRLRRFMSQSEYAECARNMYTDKARRVDPAIVDKAVAICSMMEERGYTFKIKPDTNKGQLKAVIDGTKVSIRLTDLNKNSAYVGRVYDDGYSFYFSSNSREPFVPTVEDSMNIIRYVMGERVYTQNPGYPRPMEVGRPTAKFDENKSMRAFTKPGKNGTEVFEALYKVTGNMVTGSRGNTYAQNAYLTMQNDHSSTHQVFENSGDAESFLREAISTAKANFYRSIDVERLIQEAEANAGDPDYVPQFSADTKIAPMQQIYWDVLTGKNQVYKPSVESSAEEVNMLLEGTYENEDSDEDDFKQQGSEEREAYTGTPAENVRQHLNDSIDLMFGNFDADPDTNKRFNPSVVAAFMDSNTGSVYRNNDDIVSAMYKLEFTGDEVLGEDFQTNVMKDRLIRFDPESMQRMSELESPFMKTMYNTIVSTIAGSGCRVNPEDILIDKNGVVSYTAYQDYGQSRAAKSEKMQREIHGTIGQIFEPDQDGVVETHYNGSQNKLFTPGYNAYILPERSDLNTLGQNVVERTRGEGLEQVMKKRISHTLRMDLIGSGTPVKDEDRVVGKEVGSTTSINNSYRGLYSTRYKISIKQLEGETLKDTFLRQCDMTHLSRDVVVAQMRTNRGAMHYSKDVADESTVAAESRRGDKDITIHEMANDNFKDMYMMTGRTNMAITQNHSEGYTDPVLTGSGKNQGIIRYLVEGARFDEDGKILPSEDKNARAPIMHTDAMRYADFIPADRVQMVGSNYLSASGTAGTEEHERSDGEKVKGVGMAMMTIQGLTFDDGAVISSDFAEKYGVVNEEGDVRPLMAGDKICDFAGNKSIIAKVIDRNMSPEEAKAKKLEQAVALFKENPDLDIVQAPYSAVSRFNAASAKLLMEHPMDLKLPDGSVKSGCLGFAPVIITDKTVDEKTKQYGEEEVKIGKGRKISAQLGWAFSAKGATNLLDECFSTNNGAVSDLRETLITMGLDIDETGTLREGYKPHENEERNYFHMPDVTADMDTRDVRDLFRQSVDARGGFLELPFQLDMPSGVPMQPVPNDLSSHPDRVMYQMPVLSSHMRSGQTFEDGTSMSHDYTNQYVKIFSSAVDYMKAEERLKDPTLSDKDRQAAENLKVVSKARAQSSYNDITESLKSRKFETKHNMARDDFMSHRMPNSATAVWTPDANLNLDEVAMSGKMMETLGIKEGDDWTMLWRDPILRDYGTRYMKVIRDDSLTGIAVNPLVAVVFDGDFDGDSVGLWKPGRASSKTEAMELFSFANNMLDKTTVRQYYDAEGNPSDTYVKGGYADYALMINVSMDVISSEFMDEKRKAAAEANGEDYGPTLKERRMDLERRVNEVARMDIPDAEKAAKNKDLLNELSDWSRDCLSNTCGTEIVSFNSPQEHMQSLVDMVDHGAKGSHKKLANYAMYAGFEYDKDENGHILPDTVSDLGNTKATALDVEDVELATAIKSHGTGIAGAVSQRLVMAARNVSVSENTNGKMAMQALSAMLQMSYLSTQGLLQAKHDPQQAKKLYDGVSGPVRNVWRGHKMECSFNENGDPTWRTVYNKETREPVQATKAEWIESFLDVHERGMELDGINRELVEIVADALVDPKTGFMRDIEDERVLKEMAAPMDILAYKPKDAFRTICSMAKEGRNVFEGTYNEHFAPASVRRNKEALAKGDLESLVPISPNDVKASYDPVKKKSGYMDIETKSFEDVAKEKAAAAKQGAAASVEQMVNGGSVDNPFDSAGSSGSNHRERALPAGAEAMYEQYENSHNGSGPEMGQ